jgi:hypothetical protein
MAQNSRKWNPENDPDKLTQDEKLVMIARAPEKFNHLYNKPRVKTNFTIVANDLTKVEYKNILEDARQVIDFFNKNCIINAQR